MNILGVTDIVGLVSTGAKQGTNKGYPQLLGLWSDCGLQDHPGFHPGNFGRP